MNMTLFEIGTYAFAAFGVAAAVYLILQKISRKRITEDGPIRVKGGSIKIENDDADWELDDSEGHNEFRYAGRPKGWKVKVLKNGSVCNGSNDKPARRVILEVVRDGGGNDGDVEFRANGTVRVIDEKKRFTTSGKTLNDQSKGARVKKVILKRRGQSDLECNFEESDEYYVELQPLA